MSNSLKKSIIIGLLTSPLIQEDKTNDMILITAYGMISGRPVEAHDAEPTPDGRTALPATVKALTEEYVDGIILEGNDGFIVLKNVTISAPGAPTTYMPYLLVFYDQILAASVGKPALG